MMPPINITESSSQRIDPHRSRNDITLGWLSSAVAVQNESKSTWLNVIMSIRRATTNIQVSFMYVCMGPSWNCDDGPDDDHAYTIPTFRP